MELFSIKRYEGEDVKSDDRANEELLRKKLLKKIEKRKRKKEIILEENVKAKDSNESRNEDTEVKYEKTDKNFSELKESKKNKSKKKETNESESESVSSNKENSVSNNEVAVEHKLANQTEFTVLKDPQLFKVKKVKRKLPNWLANPSVVSVDLKNLKFTIDSIPELDQRLINKLKENNITHFFPVQKQVIPYLLQNGKRPYQYWPNDICVSAPTGSGKTLAFVLPIVQMLTERIIPKVRALVVLPVQDLAIQVSKVFETYSKATNLNILLFSKMRSFEEEQNLICKKDSGGNWKTLVDIIVTTPGRLVDHFTKTEGFSLKELKYLVIDEADRIMDNVQNDWLYHLNKHINSECSRSYQVPVVTYNNMFANKRPPNKWLFSATLSQDPEKLQQLGLFHPKLFTSVIKSKKEAVKNDNADGTKFIGKFTTPAELREYYVECEKSYKPLILHHLINTQCLNKILCFVNSSNATFKLTYILRKLHNKLKIKHLSGNLTVKERNQILNNFSEGKINMLICSDALARGIDLPDVLYVVSYDSPKFIKNYVHRIGRTGRAGKEGTSVTLITNKEKKKFQEMVENAGKKFVEELKVEESEIQQYVEKFENILDHLKKKLEKNQKKALMKVKAIKRVKSLAHKGKFLKLKKKVIKQKFEKKKSKSLINNVE